MSRVPVSSSVIRWAVERSGKASTIRQKFPKLQEWERGESQPTLRQLEALAKATATPFGYLFLPEPPDERLPIPHFRTLGDQPARHPSPDLLETVYTMEQRQAWMREYLVEQGEDPLPFVRSASHGDPPREAALQMSRTLGVTGGWAASQRSWTDALRALRHKAEETGIIVAVNSIVGNNPYRKLDPAEFRGFVLVDDYAPLVFINGADGKAAQMFTLAHELAHVWLGSSAAFDLRDMQPAPDQTEQACNRIAAEFLVPEHELRELWPSVRRDPNPFQKIATHFKVSVLVAARRVLDLRLIQKSRFLEFYQTYLEDERRRSTSNQDGGDFYATQHVRLGRRFAEMLVRATKEGRLSYHEAYQLTGLYGKTFERFAEAFGYGQTA